MKRLNGRDQLLIAASLVAFGFVAATLADACTRLVYLGKGDDVITARSMDW